MGYTGSQRCCMAFTLIGLLIAGLPAAAGDAHATRDADPSSLVLVIPPVEDISRMYEQFLPLKTYLERRLGRTISLRIARTHQEAVESIGNGQAHLAYFDPSAYCEAKHRYGSKPLAKAIVGGSSAYRSVIVARTDSAIAKIVDGRGKRLALGNARSSSSSLIPAVMFKEVGIGLGDFSSVDHLEQEDRVALSVLTRRHDLGGLSERVARKYLSDGLRIIKISEAIPQYSVCACACLSPALRREIRDALLSVGSSDDAGRSGALRGIEGFAEARDRDFDVVRVMIRNLSGINYMVYGPKTIKVAILPLYSAITLFDRFEPLMRHLSLRTGYEFKLVIPRDFEDFFDIIRRGEADYSYSNPYIYIQLADKGYLSAFATTVIRSSGDIFRGIIITRKDSAIQSIHDLKGKDVMIVSYKSAGGYLAQELFLASRGIDITRDLRLREGKRQEVVILNVYRGKADAGFVRETALDVLREEIDLSKIRILATTPYIANWPFAAVRGVDARLTAVVQKSLLELDETGILSAAHIERFRTADDGEFNSLRENIQRHAVP